MNTTAIIPMRPAGRFLANLPGWTWQTKIDDERAVMRTRDGALFNRHAQSLERRKAASFGPVCEVLRAEFGAHEWLDLGLIGWRDSVTFLQSRGAVIVFDLPGGESWAVRRAKFAHLPVLDLIAGDVPRAGAPYRFADFSDAVALFGRTRGTSGLEGVVGRNDLAPYIYGDSQQMSKARWKRG